MARADAISNPSGAFSATGIPFRMPGFDFRVLPMPLKAWIFWKHGVGITLGQTLWQRPVCTWPQTAVYRSGDPALAASYSYAESP